MLSNIAQIAVKIESVEGTAETLASADVIRAFNPKFTPKIEANKRKPAKSTFSPSPSVMGARSGELTFEVELVGGAAGAAANYSAALQACGVDETLVALTSATYNPLTLAVPSVTAALYKNGKIKKIWGARGSSAKLILEAGKPGRIQITLLGADFSETDGALLTGMTPFTTMPPTFVSAALSISGYSAVVSKVELDLGLKTSLRKDANSASGHKSAIITDREPMLSIDPEDVLVASEDFMGDWRSGATAAFTTTLGATAGNTIEISAPAVQYQEIGQEERDGVDVLSIKALCTESSGDDEWQFETT